MDEPAPGELLDVGAGDASVAQVAVCLVGVLDNDLDVLLRALGQHAQPDAEAERAGRTGWGDLDEPQAFVGRLVVVHAPADALPVELDRAVDVAHFERDQLDLPVHQCSSVSDAWFNRTTR